MKKKYLLCEGSNPISKYYPGSPCRQELEVTDNIVSVVCWRCLARLVSPPPEKKSQTSSGFARGWQFMNQFVHSDGRVFHKGVEQPDLFGTLEATPVKDYEPKKKKESLDDKIQKEFYQKLKSKKGKTSKKVKQKVKK
jgi:hypothetical protein